MRATLQCVCQLTVLIFRRDDSMFHVGDKKSEWNVVRRSRSREKRIAKLVIIELELFSRLIGVTAE